MNQKRIVITGAPGTGKTAVINALEAMGFFCFHEIIRKMTAAAKNENKSPAISNPLVFVDDPFAFNTNLIKLRVKDYKDTAGKRENTLLFYDRGIPDVLAYMKYFGQSYPDSFVESCKDHRYDAVFIMPPWSEIYVADNERLESYEEALALDQHLTETYENLDYSPIIVPKMSVEKRIRFIINHFDSNS